MEKTQRYLEAIQLYFSDMWADAWNKFVLPIGTILTGMSWLEGLNIVYKVIGGGLGIAILGATLIHWIIKIQTQIAIRNHARDENNINELENQIENEVE